MATTDPKATSMMMMAARMPMASLDPGVAETAAEIGFPPSATCKTGMGEALGHPDQFLGVRRLQVRGGLVELDDGEGGVPVGRHLVFRARCQRAAHAR